MTDGFEVPTEAAAAYRRFQQSLAELATQTENLVARDFTPHEVRVDDDYLQKMASNPDASDELTRAAQLVRDGGLSWQDVIDGLVTMPAEIRELVAAGVSFALAVTPEQRRQAAAQADWDDDEDWGQPKSWLSNEW
ncbi:hypothetical protein [Speluncibacter jeojiensis]|uniref:Uncharacterized protein n=1 Tax=Speluncibacter jeojiensis TaxID=2710754 RepID=A0A9X4M6B4_9ACTN|nr:hypothetical protein [Corynebacteriales bacterium D3-21]